eukprot:TRINITY_DN18493_c0_g1_i1.p1 TRINITY_DN18493_c0_g1~~TRINITY_DN18493_c0_g1_i1.p1  ORF type:complete len:153 (+),score=8.80 TRINITY_DN18493_c0_g1_i1:75-533(+)
MCIRDRSTGTAHHRHHGAAANSTRQEAAASECVRSTSACWLSAVDAAESVVLSTAVPRIGLMGCANCKKSPQEEGGGPKYLDDWSLYYESEDEPETVRPIPHSSTDGKVLFFWSKDQRPGVTLPGTPDLPNRPMEGHRTKGQPTRHQSKVYR